MWEAGWDREVTYPRTWRQKAHNFHDSTSNRMVAKELRPGPDVACFTARTPVFNNYAQYTMRPPATPKPQVEAYFTPEQHRTGLERDLAQAGAALQPVAMIHDMLSNLDYPLREYAAFRRDISIQ